VGTEKGDIECLRLERRQRPENVPVDGDQEVGQAGEREPRLRHSRPRREHRKAQLLRAPHGRLPYRRLGDPRLADELERGETGIIRREVPSLPV
jgi:hypothetical protein